MNGMSFDSACRDLAIILLRDEPGMDVDDEIELAKQLQDVAENFIADVKAWKRLEP